MNNDSKIMKLTALVAEKKEAKEQDEMIRKKF